MKTRVKMYKRHRGVLRSGWPVREFELESGWLVKTKSRSRIDLTSATMLTPGQRLHGSPNENVIILTQGRKRWELAAMSAEDFMLWTVAIRKQLPSRQNERSDPVVEKAKAPLENAAPLETTTIPVVKQRDKRLWLLPVAVLGGWFVSVWVSLCASVFLAYKMRSSHGDESRLRDEVPTTGPQEEKDLQPKKKNSVMRIRGGCGLHEVPPTLAPPPMTWSRAPASDFRLRQKGYLTTREKGPSAEAYYRVVYVQVFDTDSRVENVTDHIDLPEPRTADAPTTDDDAPLLVVDAQLPSEVGPLRSSENADGPGHQIVIVMEPTGKPVPKLFTEFCLGRRQGRFKVVAQIRNVEKVPKLARRYNGKPALINKTGKMRTGTTKDGRSFLEMAVNVHAFGYLARYGFHSLYDRFGDYVVSAGFTIEGRDEEAGELPENIIAAFDLNYLS